MSGIDAARRLREKFGLRTPPDAADVKQNVQQPQPGRRGRPPKAEKMAQLNLRVPADTKTRVRILAARDGIEMSQVVIEGIALYEAQHGAAPVLESSRRPK